MTKPPLVSIFFAIALPLFSAGAQDAQSAMDKVADGRSKTIPLIKAALAEGDEAYKEKHYDVAAAKYQTACDLLPEAPLTHELRARALDGFSQASIRLAEQCIVEGRFADAETATKMILDPKYNPHYKPAMMLLAHLEDPDYYNHTVVSKPEDRAREITKFFEEAQVFYDTGRYDLAYKRYGQILNLDPYNLAARKGQEKVIAVKAKYDTPDSKPTSLPRAYVSHEIVRIGGAGDRRDTDYIQNKLNHIIIPRIEFKEVTVRDAIDFLKKKSIELDTTEADPARKGVNIVLRLDLPALKGVVPTTDPGEPPVSLLALGALGGLDALSIPPTDAKITLSLTNIPLSEALRYITSLAGLKMKIDPYAVVIVPLSLPSDELITKEYRLPAGFAFSKGKTPREFFEGAGIPFPMGASANFIPASGKLVVRNTESNLDLVDQIVDDLTAPW